MRFACKKPVVKSIGTIEKELGLRHNLLWQWKQHYKVNDETDELERSEIEQLKAELRQTKHELAIARQERDILKTVRIFSKGMMQ